MYKKEIMPFIKVHLLLKIIVLIFILNPIFTCYAAISSNITIIRDDEIESVIKQIINPILKITELDPHSVTINIINQADPNAFVMFGQNIFISTGLITFSSNPDALIGVLAHEAGHIKGGHLIQQSQELKNLQTKMLLGWLAGAVVGIASQSSDAAMGTMYGITNANERNFLSFTRSQENAADNVSVKVMKKLGVSSDGLLNFLGKLNTVEKTFYNDISLYERTHPLTKDRIEFIKINSSKDVSSTHITNEIRQNFKMVHAKVLGFTYPTKVVSKSFSSSNDNAAKYAKAIAYFRDKNLNASIKELDELMKQIINSPYLYELKGQILFELGLISESLPFYEKAYSLKPRSNIIAIEYANALISNNKNISNAISILKQVVSRDRNESFAWNLLGKCYQLTKEPINMHIALAYYSYLNSDIGIANKHINAIKNANIPQNERRLFKDIQQLIAENNEGN